MFSRVLKREKAKSAGDVLGKKTELKIAREIINNEGISEHELKKKLGLGASTVRMYIHDKEDSLIKKGFVVKREGGYHATKELVDLFFEHDRQKTDLSVFILYVLVNLVEMKDEVRFIIVLIALLYNLLVSRKNTGVNSKN